MNGKLQLKWNLNLKAVVANIVKSVMEYQLEQNLPALANKVKSVMGVSTQARSPIEVGTEMRSVITCDVCSTWKNENHVWKSQVRLKFATEMASTMLWNQICSVSSNWSEISDTSREWNEICDRNTKRNKIFYGSSS